MKVSVCWSSFLSLEEASGNSLESSYQGDTGCVHDVTTGIKLNVKEILSPSSTIANLQSYRHHHLHISPFRDKKSLILCFRILVDLVPVNSIAFPSHTKVAFEISQQICSWGIWDFGNIPSFLTTFTSWHPRNGIRIQKPDEARTKMMFDLCVKENRHECDSTYVLLSEPGAGIQKDHLHVNRSSHSHLLISSGKRSKQGSNLL